jgi:cell wall-associated NlpC family hydrolase
MFDVSSYIGIPYKDHGRERDGLDCWGLLRLIYKEQLGITLPSYSEEYSTAEDRDEVSRIIKRESAPWVEVSEPRPGDAILVRLMGEPWHVGVMTARNEMIHITRGTAACLDRLNGARWNRRIAGFFRYCPENE